MPATDWIHIWEQWSPWCVYGCVFQCMAEMKEVFLCGEVLLQSCTSESCDPCWGGSDHQGSHHVMQHVIVFVREPLLLHVCVMNPLHFRTPHTCPFQRDTRGQIQCVCVFRVQGLSLLTAVRGPRSSCGLSRSRQGLEAAQWKGSSMQPLSLCPFHGLAGWYLLFVQRNIKI